MAGGPDRRCLSRGAGRRAIQPAVRFGRSPPAPQSASGAGQDPRRGSFRPGRLKSPRARSVIAVTFLSLAPAPSTPAEPVALLSSNHARPSVRAALRVRGFDMVGKRAVELLGSGHCPLRYRRVVGSSGRVQLFFDSQRDEAGGCHMNGMPILPADRVGQSHRPQRRSLAPARQSAPRRYSEPR